MHVVLKGESAEWAGLQLGGRGVGAKLGRGRGGLRLPVRALGSIDRVALLMRDMIESLWPLIQPKSQVLRFAEIVQVCVTGERPVDAMARIGLGAIITDFERTHVNYVRII